MSDERLQTIGQVKQFLAGSVALDFDGVSDREIVLLPLQAHFSIRKDLGKIIIVMTEGEITRLI